MPRVGRHSGCSADSELASGEKGVRNDKDEEGVGGEGSGIRGWATAQRYSET